MDIQSILRYRSRSNSNATSEGQRSQRSSQDYTNLKASQEKAPEKKEKEEIQIEVPDFETEIESNEVKKDPLFSELFSFPTDDVDVSVLPRETITAESPIPPHSSSLTPGYLQDCIDYYEMDWIRVQRKYESSVSQSETKINSPLKKLEIEDESENASENAPPVEEKDFDDIDATLFKEYQAGVTDHVNLVHRQQTRPNIYHLMNVDPSNTKAPKKPVPFGELNSRQILVEVKKLTFAIGEMEPFFGILAVYDIVKKRRVSENFYFDLNADEISKLIEGQESAKDPITMTKKAIFNISETSQDLFLMLRVEKVLQGDLDSAVEPYLKQSSLKDKEKEKFKSVVPSYCSRLGAYHQPFCWGLIPLFNEDSELQATENSEFKPLYRQKATDIADVHFLDLVNDYTKSGSSKRNKTIPGSCIVDVSDIEMKTPGIISPSLVPLHPKASQDDEIIREIEEFRPANATVSPYASYVNNLYIYPEYLNFNNRGGSVGSRNLAIKVELFDSDEFPHAEGIKAIYGRNSESSLKTHALSCVTYHNRTPHFYDEFKIKLPLELKESHHLLFTFYHITCQAKPNKSSTETETQVGYAILPLYQGHRIIDKEHTLPVIMELAPKYLSPEVESSLKFVDNKKPLFKLRAEVVSTVYSPDKHLNNFFLACRNLSDPRLSKPLQGLAKVKPQIVLRFLPIIFNQLFRILSLHKGEETVEAFIILNQLIESVYQAFNSVAESTQILNSYIEFVFNNPEKHPVFETIAKNWSRVLGKNKDNDQCVKFSWFLFRIMFKSMVLHSKSQMKNSPVKADRKNRFSKEFSAQLKALIISLTQEIHQRNRTGITIAKDLSRSIATFLKNLFAIADRSVCFELAERTVREITSTTESESLVELKFEFLSLLCDYEHYIQLNLPIKISVKNTDLMDAFTKKHFLSGLVLRQLSQHLPNKEKAIRHKGILTLKILLRKHDLDGRYQYPSIKERIGVIYFPLILIVSDNIECVKELDFEEKRNLFICFLFILKSLPQKTLAEWLRTETQSRMAAFFQALALCADVFEFIGEEKWVEKMKDAKNSKTREAKTLLENYYNESNKGAGTGTGRYRSLREKRAAQRKASDAESRGNSGNYSTGTGTATGTGVGTGTGTGTGNMNSISNLGAGSLSRGGRFARPALSGINKSAGVDSFDETMEINLSSECSLILLDILEYLLQEFESELKSTSIWSANTFIDHIFTFWVTLFKKFQTQHFLSCLYSSSRAIITKFSRQLFTLNNTIIAELCLEVVRHCNFSSEITRKEASSCLYLLMKKNFEEDKKTFTRVKVQTTIALSKLVGKGIKTDAYLRRSLGTISKFVSSAENIDPSFAQQVGELTNRLHTILKDSVQISQHSSDPEMMADLYFRIANGYTNAPDLRVAWLESLANFNLKHNNWAEAALCFIHIAALVSEYLYRVDSESPGVPKGCASFINVSRNLNDEATLEKISKEAIYDSKSQIFSESGLLKIMNESLVHLKQAELYETAGELYKLILPIHEHRRDFEVISKSYGDLKDIYHKIVETTQKQSRYLGSYYRVGFYGSHFKELEGKEFIYKEPKITRLGEIKDRLVDIFAPRFGEEKIRMITDSGAVDPSKLDQNFVHLQITSVIPYFAPADAKHRKTYYEQNSHVDKFIFSTPFTTSGKAQADSVKDQHKRKTILTTAKYFPYLKRRVEIIKKEEIVLPPIENSIEIMESRIDSITAEVNSQRPSAKTLHLILQGTLLAAVNAGPKDIAVSFLGKNSGDYPQDKVVQLKACFNQFLQVCENALALDKTLITSGDQDFYNELENGFHELQQFIQQKLSE